MVAISVLSGSVTVANVTLPAITADFDSALSVAWWTVYGYLLAFAALLPPAGRLGDRFGPVRTLQAGLIVFAAASIVCALAPDVLVLVTARVAQGAGAALATPQAMTVLTRTFPPQCRGRAFGALGVVAGLAVAVSPVLGGAAVDYVGWRWMYALTGLAVLVAVVLATRLPALRPPNRPRLDLAGAALLGGSLLVGVYLLLEGVPDPLREHAGPFAFPLAVTLPALLFLCFVQTQRRVREPLLPGAVLRAAHFSLMALTTAALSCAVTGMVLLTAVQLQTAASLSAVQAGLVIAVAPAVSLPFASLSGRWTDRHGGRGPLLTGLALMALGLGCLPAALHVGSDWRLLLPGLIVFGVGMGVVFAPPGVLAMAKMPSELVGAASGAMSTLRILGSTTGTAATGAVLQLGLSRLPETQRLAAETLSPAVGLAAGEGVSHAVAAAFLLPVGALIAAFLGCAVAMRGQGRGGVD